MRYSVEVEKPSEIVRKFTIVVPAEEVKSRFDKGLVTVQKTAKIKGFREGHVPLSVVKQFYGDDVRHQVFHNLIDESFEKAVGEHKLRAIGRPAIETPEHKTGDGAHDHTLHEDKDLTFTATFEVIPEIKVKGYTGLSLTQDKVEVTDEQVQKVIKNLHESHAELVPLSGGLVLADGTSSVRPIQKGDFVDTEFVGGLVNGSAVELRDDMKGQRVIEIGSGSFIPGFEEEIIGMRTGETKAFRITFPKDYGHADFAEKVAEFKVTAHDIKEKKLPAFDDEFAKGAGYENLADLNAKAKEAVLNEKTSDSERKLRSDLLAELIKKNPIEVPSTLIEAQTREMAQELAQDLKRDGYSEELVRDILTKEMGNLKMRAESQIKASLILESIAKEEGLHIGPAEIQEEFKRLSALVKIEEDKMRDYYAKNPGRMEDLEFRLRQDRTVKFLLEKAKIKAVPPSDK